MSKLDISLLKALAPKGKTSTPIKLPPMSGIDAGELSKKVQRQALQIELLNLIIERYNRFIEDGETKSLSDLKSMVKPLDAAVTEIKIQIEDQFHPYNYDSNYLLATQKVLDIIFTWKKIKMPLSFWMSFEDMAKLKAADDLDRAILVCSVFRSLGSDSAKVIIGKNKEAWVSFVFSQKAYIVNIADKTMSAYPPEGDGLKQFMYNAAYSFNDREVEEFGSDKQNSHTPS